MSLKASYYLNVVLAGVLLMVVLSAGSETEAGPESPENETEVGALPQRILPVDLSGDFDFAGETMPRSLDALERLDRELSVNSYWHSNTLITIKEAGRYFPVIEKILAEEGVPEDFKYVALAESGLRNVTSPAGAKGFWQLMPAVAKMHGLKMNSTIEERYHLHKATRAACAHIKQYKQRFGTWTNAAAAYNIGETRFHRELGSQKEDSYYDMNFGEETNRYLFRILAIKAILENPSKFGFVLDEDSSYDQIACYEVEVTEDIPSLSDFAHKYGCSYRMLKKVNPWMISNELDIAPGERLTVLVPKS